MNRRLLAALALVVLVGLAGCTSILGSDAGDPEALSADAEYDYDTDRDAFITVNRENYTAVYNVSAKVTGDEDTIELWRTNALTIENPLELEGLQFRYTNGTIVRYVDGEAVVLRGGGIQESTDALSVETTRQRTIVHLPAEEASWRSPRRKPVRRSQSTHPSTGATKSRSRRDGTRPCHFCHERGRRTTIAPS